MKAITIHNRDNVAVALEDLHQGELVDTSVTVLEFIAKGHKVAIQDINKGEKVIKYGFPIGHATQDIKKGQWVHTHNLKTDLSDIVEYEYHPNLREKGQIKPRTFHGYRRAGGLVGVRNEIWIIPTVGCVNRIAQLIAQQAMHRFTMTNVDGVFACTHPYGCSQMGEDQLNTQKVLANLVHHPNAGGVLVLGLGCENNNIEVFKKVLGDYDEKRVKFLNAQDVVDEVETGLQLVRELIDYASGFTREECSTADLVIGLKCGGSDGFSGITANPLVGVISDKMIEAGGSSVLTEVPEMFGAETIFMARASSREVFDKIVNLINDFKQYFMSYDQPVYENPSPGNKRGGISTLEEKSLGCTQKGGTSNVVDVLKYGDRVREKGFNLLNGPGNDAVAATILAAAGCHMILFTTGRGNPLGTMVPTVKISSNSDLYQKKPHWIDFDAGRLLAGNNLDSLAEELMDYILEVASGKATKAEHMGFKEIAIFKNGVTL